MAFLRTQAMPLTGCERFLFGLMIAALFVIGSAPRLGKRYERFLFGLMIAALFVIGSVPCLGKR